MDFASIILKKIGASEHRESWWELENTHKFFKVQFYHV